MYKIILLSISIAVGVLYACQDSDSVETSVLDSSYVYIDDGVNGVADAIDSLNLEYAKLFLSSDYVDSRATEQHTKEPKDSLDLLPPQVDMWGGIAGEIIIAAAIGSSLGPMGTIGGAVVGVVLSHLSSEVAATATSSIAQYVYDCAGLAMVTPPYISSNNIIIPCGLEDGNDWRYSYPIGYVGYMDSIGWRHNKILAECAIDFPKENCSEYRVRAYEILDSCIVKHNRISPDSLRIDFSQEYKDKLIDVIIALCSESVNVLNGESSYSTFIESSSNIMVDHFNIAENDSRLVMMKNVNIPVLEMYSSLPVEYKESYSGQVNQILHDASISDDLKSSTIIANQIGLNSSLYWNPVDINE